MRSKRIIDTETSDPRLELIELRSGALTVEVFPKCGARLHRIRFHDSDVLRTPATPATHMSDPLYWGAYIMAPWCNRVEAGKGSLNGQIVEFRKNFHDGTAVHGLVFDQEWEVTGRGDFRLTRPADRCWPWDFEARQSIRVDPTSVTQRFSIRNCDDEPMPAGIGLHPWFASTTAIGFGSKLAFESNSFPSRRPSDLQSEFDLSKWQQPPAGIDATWVLDEREVTIEMASGIRCHLTLSEKFTHLAIASPTDVDATAVEPQTHAPGARGREAQSDGLTILEPGAELSASIQWSFSTRP